MFPETITVLLIDDQPLFRQGLRTLLSLFTGAKAYRFEIVGEAYAVEQALQLQRTFKPNLILLDLELNHSNGIDLLHQLQQDHAPGKTLVISAHQEPEWVFQAMKAGAAGYIFKSFLGTQLQPAITAVLNQQVYLSPEVATPFFSKFQGYVKQQQETPKVVALTERERDVLRCLIAGTSNEQIAQELFITVATVKAHLTTIFNKLGVKNRSQAILAVVQSGFNLV
jgi:DNA-binding NarL/FixJ family response regulator